MNNKIIILAIIALYFQNVMTNTSCQIDSGNNSASMCKELYSDYCLNDENSIPTDNMACAIANYTPGSTAALDWTVTSGADASVNCSGSDVIQCFNFAAVGKVGGACTQITDDSEECHFKEDPSGIIEQVPDSILSECIGLTICNIEVNDTGFTVKSVDGQTVLATANYGNASQFTGEDGLKLKVVPICGPNGGEPTCEVGDDDDNDDDDDDGENSSILFFINMVFGFLMISII